MVMNKNTSRPSYELRLAAIGMIESHCMPLCTGMRAPTKHGTDRRERVNEQAGQDASDQT